MNFSSAVTGMNSNGSVNMTSPVSPNFGGGVGQTSTLTEVPFKPPAPPATPGENIAALIIFAATLAVIMMSLVGDKR